jgi:hypothetical protein
MHVPQNPDTGFLRLARIAGVLLVLAGIVSLLLPTVEHDILPPAEGYVETNAELVKKSRRGTFQEPAFSITLMYTITQPDNTTETIRSGRRVPFQTYNALSETRQVTIHYNPDDPFEWRLEAYPVRQGLPGPYAPGVLTLAVGLFLVALPAIMRLALRYEDFDTFPEEANANNNTGY